MEENVNFVNAPAIAEERGIARERVRARARRATTQTWSRSRSSPTASASRSAGTTFGPRNVPHLVSRLRAELQHRARAPHGRLPLLGPAGHDRPGRHRARRARRQHRLDSGRARARPGARRPAGGGSGRHRRDGRDRGLAGARRRDRARSWRSRASRTAARSRSSGGPGRALAPDLFFASKIDATLKAAGHDVTLRRRLDRDPGDAEVVIVDLDHAGAGCCAGRSAEARLLLPRGRRHPPEGRGGGLRSGGPALAHGARDAAARGLAARVAVAPTTLFIRRPDR